ncbi:MAG TPA: hypothetical protein DCM05_13745 [Elusimicrobia bacterium]|nr:hypothetical protein [Elusimicrobiota bacterium]
MKRIAAAILFLAASGAWAGVERDTETPDLVSIGHGAQVLEGETVGDMVVVGGSATVRGTVEGDLVVIGGAADLDGTVVGDMVALGAARLGPKASVGKDLVVLGGALDMDPGAKVAKARTVISPGSIGRPGGGAWEWAKSGLLRARPIAPALWWSWVLAAAFGLLYALVAAGAPAPVEACAQALQGRPFTALLAGVLGLTGLAPFAFLLVASVIGIAALPLVFFAALAMIFAGKAGVCVLIGRWSGGLLKTAAFEKTAAAAAAGAALLFLCCAVPIAGLGVWALTTVLGFGAALLAGVDSLQRERGALAESAPAAEAPADATAAQPPAGFWLRLGATVIDGLAFLLIGGLTHLLVLGLGGWALYQVGMWAWKGTTLGGMAMGIRGVRVDGRPMDVPVALVRHLASWLSALPMFLGFFWAGWDPEKRSWHDKIAGTVVVLEPRRRA